jgi:insertion element IS1 protein InsB
LWIIKAIDRRTRKCIAWITGDRDIATFRRLFNKLKHLNCTFYTDDWNAFSAVIPPERHRVGWKHTTAIEQNNSNTRHYLGRMTRRTKVVSHSEEMLERMLKLWRVTAEYGGWQELSERASSIFT